MLQVEAGDQTDNFGDENMFLKMLQTAVLVFHTGLVKHCFLHFIIFRGAAALSVPILPVAMIRCVCSLN